MTCYTPLHGFQGASGKITKQYDPYGPIRPYIAVGCGQCIGCKISRTQSTAIRATHEAQMHTQNCFLTLTYSDANLPAFGSLYPENLTNFFKKLRNRYPTDEKIRYLACGEYGENLSRPHYHVCLFGADFSHDTTIWKRRGAKTDYRSKLLEKLWPHGYSTIGPMTWQTAVYTARYVMKKINGTDAEDHYESIDQETGEILEFKIPEFIKYSNRPGLGATWFKKYWKSCYPSDQVVVNGKQYPVPRYYDKLYEVMDPEAFALVKAKRIEAAQTADRQLNNTTQRLKDRQLHKELTIKKLKRNYEGKNDDFERI